MNAATTAPLLDVNGIEVIYSHVILVLKGVSLQVPEGKVVALLGGNGAGKTTTLRAVSNLLKGERGEVTKGTIRLRGERIERLSTSDMVERGVIQVMEGRHCFGHLTIEENLLTGAFTRKDGNAAIKRDLEGIYDYFPRLRQRKGSMAGYTSGGEQQMCAIGRAMMSKPKMILLDEPSMGLAPQVVEEIFEIVKTLNTKEGVSFLLAEQNTNIALRYATYGYILETGRVVMDGHDVTNLPMYRRARLGLGYLPQEASIFRGLSVEDNIRAALEVVEPVRDRREQMLDSLLAEFGIAHLRRAPALALSGGERRRAEIARALAADPSIMLLDEPFAGIDPISIADIRGLVCQLKERGIGVLITDHNVRETLDIVDRAYIIYDGRVLFTGSPAELVADESVRRLYLGEGFSL